MTEYEWLKCDNFATMNSHLDKEQGLLHSYPLNKALAQAFKGTFENLKWTYYWKNVKGKEKTITLQLETWNKENDKCRLIENINIEEYKAIKILHEVIGNPFITLNQCKICEGRGYFTEPIIYEGKLRTFQNYCKNCLGSKEDRKWINEKIKQLFKEALQENKLNQSFPIIADACEDAGCIDQDILMHLRGFRKRLINIYNYEWIYDHTVSHLPQCWIIRDILK